MLEEESTTSSMEGVYTEESGVEDIPVETEKIFQGLLNLMPDPVVIVDGKGKFLAVNDRVEEISGFQREELLGKNFIKTKIVTTRSKASLLKNLAKRMMGLRIAPYEIEGLTKDGEKIPFEVNAKKIEYRDKAADLVIFRDITERKKARQALKKSEEKYRTVVEHSLQGIVIAQDYRIVYANKTFAKISGYSAKELLSLPPEKVRGMVHPDDQALVWERFRERVAGKQVPSRYECRALQKDGTMLWLEMFAHPIEYNGKPAVQVAVMDITKRKKMEEQLKEYTEHLEEMVEKRTAKLKETEEALRESEERLRQLLEHAPEAIYLNDLNGNFIDGNKLAEEMVGYKREELIGKNMFAAGLLPEEYLQKAVEGLEKNRRGERSGPEEFELIRKDGSRITAEVSAFPVKRKGETQIIGIARDITERKRMEKLLLSSERLAAIGQVATMVGHDLRNPLQSIENATYYLNEELPRLSPWPPIPKKVMEMLQAIKDSVNYADKIVRDLQDFSRNKKPILKKTNINATLKEALSQAEIPESVELVTKLDLHPEINADKYMIERVFLNLTLNAIQAMEKGGKLTVSNKIAKGFVEVSFKDTGLGVSKQDIKKIFTPFFTTKAKGMGIGLAICKRFVETHGGSIEVESDEGEGSTFTVKLPIKYIQTKQ